MVNTVSTNFDEMENDIIYKAGWKEQTINRNDLLRAQMKDPTIRRMIELKHKNVDQLSDEEKRRESEEVKALLRHWNKLNVDKDGILCRVAPDRNQKQVVIPPSFRPLVYSELHVDKGHLGAERVTDLAKDRFFWINMMKNIKHFTTDVCSYVKQKKPHITKAVPMKPVHSTAPMELIGMEFLHLDQCSGGFQYILVITVSFEGLLKCTLLAIKRQKQQLKSSKMTLFYVLASREVSSTTKSESLSFHTICKEMANMNI